MSVRTWGFDREEDEVVVVVVSMFMSNTGKFDRSTVRIPDFILWLEVVDGTGTDRSRSSNGCARICGPCVFPCPFWIFADFSDLEQFSLATGVTSGDELREDDGDRVMKINSDSVDDREEDGE